MTQATVVVRLNKAVPGLGHAGQVAQVRFGYARNYLLPRGLAELATGRQAAAQLGTQQRMTPSSVNEHNGVKAIAAALVGQTATLTAAANEDGTLFAGIQATDIAEALRTDPVFRIEPIKHTGQHQVTLDFGHDITAVVTVTVKPTRQPKAK